MNYIKLQKGFNKYCKMIFLPALSRLLWFDLVELFNELGWPEWIQISNARLMDGLQITSDKKFIEVRDKLIEHSLFIYEKGKKGFPNRYKFNLQIDFLKQAYFESTSESTNGSQNAVQMEAQMGDINKLNKTKLNKTEENVFTSVNTSKKNADKTCFGEFENVFLTTAEREKLVSRAGETETDELIERLSRYIASHGKKYKSHYATLLNWYLNPKKSEFGGENFVKREFKCSREYPE